MGPKAPASSPAFDQSGQTQTKNAFGTYYDTMRAWWLKRGANLIRAERKSEAEHAYREYYRFKGFHRGLEKAFRSMM